MLLAISVSVAGVAFPFLPRHLTIIGSLTIGIPAFFLALEPTARRARTGFVKRVMEFAVPTGTLAALATFLAYRMAFFEGVPLDVARTVATLVLCSIGFFVLVVISRPLNPGRRLLVASMVALLLLIVLMPSGREFYAISLPGPVLLLASGGVVGLTGAVMYFTLRTLGWLRNVPAMRTVADTAGRVRRAVADVAAPGVRRLRDEAASAGEAGAAWLVRVRRRLRSRVRRRSSGPRDDG